MPRTLRRWPRRTASSWRPSRRSGVRAAAISHRTHYGVDGIVFFNGESVPMRRVIGMDWATEGRMISGLQIVSGNPADMSDPRGALISEVTARRLGARVGDQVTLQVNRDGRGRQHRVPLGEGDLSRGEHLRVLHPVRGPPRARPGPRVRPRLLRHDRRLPGRLPRGGPGSGEDQQRVGRAVHRGAGPDLHDRDPHPAAGALPR